MARTRTRHSDVSNEPSHATSLLVLVVEHEQRGGIGTNMVSAKWGRPTHWSSRATRAWASSRPAIWALMGLAHGNPPDSPRATWGGSAPVDELLSAPSVAVWVFLWERNAIVIQSDRALSGPRGALQPISIFELPYI